MVYISHKKGDNKIYGPGSIYGRKYFFVFINQNVANNFKQEWKKFGKGSLINLQEMNWTKLAEKSLNDKIYPIANPDIKINYTNGGNFMASLSENFEITSDAIFGSDGKISGDYDFDKEEFKDYEDYEDYYDRDDYED